MEITKKEEYEKILKEEFFANEDEIKEYVNNVVIDRDLLETSADNFICIICKNFAHDPCACQN